jgi:hypothetical protein
MTDRTQFEAMLEALINEDQETAKEIFHNIVVAKSREIYEELLSEDFDLEEGENPFAEKDDEEDADADTDSDSEADDSEADDSDVGGDATDDFIDDVSDEEGEEGEEGDMSDEEQTDRIMDLEDALEELKAEFEQLMAGDDDAGDMDADMGGDDMEMGGDDMGMGPDEMDNDMQRMMEYTRKVSLPKHGDNGVNTKSAVAGKNDMGGTTANIAKNFSTEKGGTEGGLASPKAGDLTSGLGKIHNRKDSNAGKTAFKKTEPGHGAEKKGKPEQADKSAGSLLNGVKSRAK